ncbi:hypothetical protein QSI_1840 [Clostridioides difficile P28]|nr:hypothetical protein QSI_1840 [Clostridioides difficile P28]
MSTLNRNVPFFCYKCTDLETEEKKQKQLSNVSVSASVSDISENFPLQEYIPFL